MQHFPVFLALRDRPVLVVGGGAAAASKAALLGRAGARVRVVAPDPGDEVVSAATAGRLTLVRRMFRPADLAGIALVIGASGGACDAAVAAAARAAGVLVNIVDQRGDQGADQGGFSSFVMPAIVDRDPILVAISSGGAAPVLARRLRAWLESRLPARLGRLAVLAARFRRPVRAAIPDAGARRRFWEWLFEGALLPVGPGAGGFVGLSVGSPGVDGPGVDGTGADDSGVDDSAADLVTGDEAVVAARLGALLADRGRLSDLLGGGAAATVDVVGVGPGDADLLTFRALQRLQSADLVVFDPRTVAPALADYARREAQRLPLEGLDGAPAIAAAWAAQVAGAALDGRRVVLLVAGAGREADLPAGLRAGLYGRGIALAWVPGVASSSVGAAEPVRVPEVVAYFQCSDGVSDASSGGHRQSCP